MNDFPSEYAANTVACKLWSLVNDRSPIEHILGVALFKELSRLRGYCWVYSPTGFAINSQALRSGRSALALVPGQGVLGVGCVDFAIFDPQISVRDPLVVVECDGHEFHCTPEQASEDRRRDRVLQRLGIASFRFPGRDIVRNTTIIAQEI